MPKPIIVETEENKKKHMEAVQEKVLIYQILKQQLENVQSQSLLLENAFMELENSKQALSDLNVSKESDVLIPLGSGCYAHGNMANSGSVLMNVGAGVVVGKPISLALEKLEEKRKEIEKHFEELQRNMQMLVGEINKVATDFEDIENK
jgi:prefoldin alpha subunit